METPTPQPSDSPSSTLDQNKPGAWERSTTRRFILWFSHWKNLRKILFPILILITLLALFIAEENWRGKRNWDRYAKTLVERGEPVMYTDIIPPPVPDDKNFAAIPYLMAVMKRGPDGFNLGKGRWPDDFGNAQDGASKIRIRDDNAPKKPHQRFGLADLMALEMSYRNVKFGETKKDLTLPSVQDQEARAKSGAALIEFLRIYDPVLIEMRQAMDRPYSRFDIEYDVPNPAMVMLPHLSVIRNVCQILNSKAICELAVGNSEQALEDVLLMRRFSDSIKSEPILISYLVRMACVRITLSVLWDGLATHAWTDSQLETLQSALSKDDFLMDAILAFKGERAFGNGIYDFLRAANSKSMGNGLTDLGDSDYAMAGFFISLFPRGWLYMEQLNSNRLFDEFVQPKIVPSAQRIDPSLLDEKSNKLNQELHEGSNFKAILKHKILARLLLPALGKVPSKGAQTQAMVELAQLACAVERFRLSNKQMPENLQALVPEFVASLPNDVVSDSPYLYQVQPEGGFRLYSIGWNEQDDGGQEDQDSSKGDWAWTPYPVMD